MREKQTINSNSDLTEMDNTKSSDKHFLITFRQIINIMYQTNILVGGICFFFFFLHNVICMCVFVNTNMKETNVDR